MRRRHSERRLISLLLEDEDRYRLTLAVETACKADTGISVDYDSVKIIATDCRMNKFRLMPMLSENQRSQIGLA